VQLRIVAATHQDLPARVEQGRFRADLYFRLRVLQLAVPPLREREGDAVFLARHFCQQFAERYRRAGLRLSADAEAAIAAHAWPGNVRELRNLIEQAVLLGMGDSGEVIEADALMLPPPARPTVPPAVTEGAASALDRVERDMLVQALAQAQHNVSQAARALGVSRDTLRYRMEKHGLRGS